MRVIAKALLRDFWEHHPDARDPLVLWFRRAKGADWTKAADVKADYASASILPNDRVVFNICGNKYRLVALVRYEWHVVYIRFIGTHAEYDEIDAENA
ncbi:MAG TPA: type II toxin-antitoxin system HigB family toxin [Planctomycetota bacterium]